MQKHENILNPHLSVDCVVFGFTGEHLKVLLIERTTPSGKDYKLPGDFIYDTEDLQRAAERILTNLTGLEDIFLHQFAVFGRPDRIHAPEDFQWLRETTGLPVNRVVTTAFFSLVRIDESKRENALRAGASWHRVSSLPTLAFDHREIIFAGQKALQKEVRFAPICFELLPGKFTIRQIQRLYEVILDHPLDNRNFRKKLLKAPYLVPLNEKQEGVAHKPARFYRFDRELYERSHAEIYEYNF